MRPLGGARSYYPTLFSKNAISPHLFTPIAYTSIRGGLGPIDVHSQGRDRNRMSSPLPSHLPFSPCTPAGGFLFLSGMLGNRPGEMALVSADVEAQTRQAIEHIQTLLAPYGAGLAQVVKATLYLTDLEDWDAVNRVWVECFKQPYPSRTAVQVAKLKLEARIEIDIIALNPREAQ